MTLSVEDILIGHVYEAKKPKGIVFVDDRQVVYVSRVDDRVQYDSPYVSNGRRFPKMTMKRFLEWAGRDITNEMPKDGSWRLMMGIDTKKDEKE